MSDTEKATGYTTETIREDLVQTSSWRFMQHKIGPEFDRWLAAHDTEQREAGRLAALEEAEQIAYMVHYSAECSTDGMLGPRMQARSNAGLEIRNAIRRLRSSSPYRTDQNGEQP